MVQIRWTEEAERWLYDIYSYIAADNPDAALNVVLGIQERVRLLVDFPEIGYFYREEPEGHIRIIVYGHYRIAYLIRSAKTLDILGVFHGALDLTKYL